MTTERDELALRFLHQDFPYYSPVPTSMDDPRIDPEHKEYAYVSVEIVEAAGYRKPRTVTTVEELDALPVGSVVLDGNGFTWDKWRDEEGDEFNYWATTLDQRPYHAGRINLPATVLHEGDA